MWLASVSDGAVPSCSTMVNTRAEWMRDDNERRAECLSQHQGMERQEKERKRGWIKVALLRGWLGRFNNCLSLAPSSASRHRRSSIIIQQQISIIIVRLMGLPDSPRTVGPALHKVKHHSTSPNHPLGTAQRPVSSSCCGVDRGEEKYLSPLCLIYFPRHRGSPHPSVVLDERDSSPDVHTQL